MKKLAMGNNKKLGFTIIEVVLVLAIAGLIFLMVFVAFPALNAAQRNTQRKRDVDRVAGAIIQYQKNNKGKLPFYIKRDSNGNYKGQGDTFDKSFIRRYVDENCSDAVADNAYIPKNASGQTEEEERDTWNPAEHDGRPWTPWNTTTGESYWGDKHYSFTGCGESFIDPDGTPYTVVILNGDSDGYLYSSNVDHMLAFAAGCKCDDIKGEGHRARTKNPNDYLIFMTLEMGQSYCVDNQ